MKKYFLLLALLLGCGTPKPLIEINEAEITSGTWLVYEGSLPCADCSEIKTRLEMKIDYSNPEPPFILKQVYIGAKSEDQVFIQNGQYGTLKVEFRGDDATAYELNPRKPEERLYFLRVNDDTLRMLNREVKEFKTELNYNLVRTETIKNR